MLELSASGKWEVKIMSLGQMQRQDGPIFLPVSSEKCNFV